jgi:hypothetical protein
MFESCTTIIDVLLRLLFFAFRSETVESEALRVIDAMLLMGANCNAASRYTETLFTPLHMCAYHNLNDICARLLKVPGIVVDSQTFPNKQTPLHLAAEQGHHSIVQQLIVAGADITILCSRSGFSPLHYAAEGGFNDIVVTLLKCHADINQLSTVNQLTPVMVATKNLRDRVACTLIDAGADLDGFDVVGRSALTRALAAWNPNVGFNIIRLLLTTMSPISYDDYQNCFSAAPVRLCCFLLANLQFDSACELILNKLYYLTNDDRLMLLAAGAEFHPFRSFCTLKQLEDSDSKERRLLYQHRAEIEKERRELILFAFDRFKVRCLEICIALQSLHLPALVTLHIIDNACSRRGAIFLSMHLKWQLIAHVKHFIE